MREAREEPFVRDPRVRRQLSTRMGGGPLVMSFSADLSGSLVAVRYACCELRIACRIAYCGPLFESPVRFAGWIAYADLLQVNRAARSSRYLWRLIRVARGGSLVGSRIAVRFSGHSGGSFVGSLVAGRFGSLDVGCFSGRASRITVRVAHCGSLVGSLAAVRLSGRSRRFAC